MCLRPCFAEQRQANNNLVCWQTAGDLFVDNSAETYFVYERVRRTFKATHKVIVSFVRTAPNPIMCWIISFLGGGPQCGKWGEKKTVLISRVDSLISHVK